MIYSTDTIHELGLVATDVSLYESVTSVVKCHLLGRLMSKKMKTKKKEENKMS